MYRQGDSLSRTIGRKVPLVSCRELPLWPCCKKFHTPAYGLTLLVLALAAVAGAADKPLKVFILAGQSNMQGHASVSTFDSLADDPKTAPLLKEMRDKDGKPKVCEKVWITSVGCLGDAYSDLHEAEGQADGRVRCARRTRSGRSSRSA